MPGPGIKMNKVNVATSIEASKFLKELFKDKESLKIFRQFWNRGIIICLADRYHVADRYCVDGRGVIWVNARDSVKKVAEWLKTGKI